MKSKLSTTLALVGVLAAGTAAAAVNTQALQSKAESTIGSGTTTLVAPITPVSEVSTSMDPISLDANETPTDPTMLPADDTSGTNVSSTPKPKPLAVKTASASPEASVIYTNPNPSSGDDDDDDDEDDDDDDDDRGNNHEDEDGDDD